MDNANADMIPNLYNGLEITSDGYDLIEVYKDGGEWWADGKSWGTNPMAAARALMDAGYTRA